MLGWTQFARLIYANVLSVSEKEYVESARAIGTSNFKIVTKYVLPNSFAPILIAITFQMASAILSESSLSFLGMGVQPPGASWGNMLYDAQSITVLSQKLWIWLPPGLALLITVLSINFSGRRHPRCAGSENQTVMSQDHEGLDARPDSPLT